MDSSPIFNIHIGRGDNRVEEKLIIVAQSKVSPSIPTPKNSFLPLKYQKDLGIN